MGTENLEKSQVEKEPISNRKDQVGRSATQVN